MSSAVLAGRTKLESLADEAEERAAAAARRQGIPQAWGPIAAATMRATAVRLDGKPSQEAWPPIGDHAIAGDIFLTLREAGATLDFADAARRAACPCGLCNPGAP